MHSHEAKQLLHAARMSLRDVLLSPPAPRCGALLVDASNGHVLAETHGRDAITNLVELYKSRAPPSSATRSVDVYASLAPRSSPGCDEVLRGLEPAF